MIKTDNRIEIFKLMSDGMHKSISTMELRINDLENRVTILEVENVLLRESANAK
ncbi:hypothetical protein LCGC14_0387620 [marine sediment metagenome]|uniref:Uncharacterized protein n=1 Tax=marine sediment metagenome TaxID=412755 RepID=A0A0F9T0G6_9ZZZZ